MKSIPKALKFFAGAAAFLFLLGGALYVAVPHYAKPYLAESLGQTLHRQVSIGRIGFNPFALSARLEDITVKERDGKTDFVKIGELYVNLEAQSILERRLVLSEIKLVSPEVRIVREKNAWNFSDILDAFSKPSAKPSEKPLRFDFDNIGLEQGKVDFDDGEQKHVLSAIDLSIPELSNLPDAAVPHLSLKASLDGAPLEISGKSGVFAPDLETKLRMQVKGLDLPPFMKLLPKQKFAIDSASLDADLTANFSKGKDASLSGTVALNRVSVHMKQQPLFSAEKLSADIAAIDSKKILFNDISLEKPALDLTRTKSGLDVAALFPSGGKGPSPLFEAKKIRVSDGSLHFTDRSLPRRFETRIGHIDLSLKDISTARDRTASMQASFATDSGEKFSETGKLSLAPFSAQGKARFDQVNLAKYSPYYSDLIRFDVDSGKLDLSGGFRIGSKTAFTDVVAKLSDLSLSRTVRKKYRFFTMDSLSLKGGDFDVSKRNIIADSVSLKGASLTLFRNAKGEINVANLLPPSSGKPSAPWSYEIGKISVEGSNAQFRSVTAGRYSSIRAENIDLKVSRIGNRNHEFSSIDLKSTLGNASHLNAKGKISLEPLQLALDIDAKRVAIVPFQPYFANLLNITITDGAVYAKGKLRYGAKGAGYYGNLGIGRFASIDRKHSEEFLNWKSLRLNAVKARILPSARVSIGKISLKDFYSRLVINPDGTFNLQQIFSSNGKSSGNGKTPIRIGSVELSGGRVNFHDHFIHPNYAADLTGLAGTVSGLSSGNRADIALSGKVNDQGSLDIQGKIDPLSGNLYLDLLAKLKDFELSPLTPYAEKYAGYGISKGKLDFNVKYHVENRKLTAENHLILRQLTFGEKVDRPTATKLPVLLAVALLKDGEGNISIDLPISGSLDDPQFDVGSIIAKAIFNMILKAVTSPFTMIASIFSDHQQEMSHIDFAPGSDALPADAPSRLDALAKALKARPGLKLDVIGMTNPADDQEGLKKIGLERLVKVEKMQELLKRGQSVRSVQDIRIAPEEYPKYLEMAYDDAKLPNKPRNFIGFAKRLPVPEMESLLLASIRVGPGDLRDLAGRRAGRVRDYLLQEGHADPDRIFIVDAGRDEKKLSRVEFVLGAR
ncbi:MAG: DUF748 domain-containing protein [Burkholderiales bacterium]|nr:DUF748 domain-containing protein [Burkholderiales bacterium]